MWNLSNQPLFPGDSLVMQLPLPVRRCVAVRVFVLPSPVLAVLHAAGASTPPAQ